MLARASAGVLLLLEKGGVLLAARSFYFLKLAQALVDPYVAEEGESSDASSSQHCCFGSLQKALLEPLGLTKTGSSARLAAIVRERTTPYLKYAWFLAHMCGELPSDVALSHDSLLAAFGIDVTLASPHDMLKRLYASWASASGNALRSHIATNAMPSAIYTLQPRQLIDLPDEFTKLYSMAHTGTCKYCSRPAHDVAVCLICGDYVVAGAQCSRDPKRRGEATTHACKLHAGVGVFFLLHRCSVLLMRGKRGAYFPSLYVDKNGESHRGPTRGLPMFLQPSRLRRVNELWTSHKIAKRVTDLRSRGRTVIRDDYY